MKQQNLTDTHSEQTPPAEHPPQIMLTLRKDTSAAHQQMEDAPVMRNLLEGTLSTEGYTALLQSLYSLISPLEAAAVAHPIWTRTTNFDYTQRLKSGRILKDIAYLKNSAPEDVLLLSRAVRLPDIHNDARLLGALYVVEGASLGGRVILKLLSEHYGYTEERAASFYSGYGHDTGQRWREWCDFVEGCAGRLDLDYAEIVNGARDTFSCFGEALSDV